MGVGFERTVDDLFGELEFARAEFLVSEGVASGFIQEIIEVDALGLAVFFKLAFGFAVEGGEDFRVGVVAVEVEVRAEKEQVVAQMAVR